MSRPYCIYGASGHSKVIIEILENSGENIYALYDDDIHKTKLLDYRVTNQPDIFGRDSTQWIIGIGDNEIRKKIADSHSLIYGVAIDKTARISKRTKIGDGTVMMPGVSINTSTVVGNHVIINTNSSVDHDCNIADYAHISPNAAVCGGVSIGQGTHVGAAAVIIPGITIGNWVRIGAGAVIIKDVPDGQTVVGNPGRIIKSLKK